jgi:hypothetical protein
VKYYHGSPRKVRHIVWTPTDTYESIGPGGCPELLGTPDYAGFKSSRVKEICFSKSMLGAVTAIAQHCPMDKPCIVYIYATEEEPDVDISDCDGDFSTLEEVRYRRPIRVRYVRKVSVPMTVVKKFTAKIAKVEDVLDGMTPEAWDWHSAWLKRAIRKRL